MTAHRQAESGSEGDRSVGHLFDRQLARCPVCGSEQLEAVVENTTQEVHFLCHACSRCWHVELGYVHRIVPLTCLGCPERDRCEAVYAADQIQTRSSP